MHGEYWWGNLFENVHLRWCKENKSIILRYILGFLKMKYDVYVLVNAFIQIGTSVTNPSLCKISTSSYFRCLKVMFNVKSSTVSMFVTYVINVLDICK